MQGKAGNSVPVVARRSGAAASTIVAIVAARRGAALVAVVAGSFIWMESSHVSIVVVWQKRCGWVEINPSINDSAWTQKGRVKRDAASPFSQSSEVDGFSVLISRQTCNVPSKRSPPGFS